MKSILDMEQMHKSEQIQSIIVKISPIKSVPEKSSYIPNNFYLVKFRINTANCKKKLSQAKELFSDLFIQTYSLNIK